MSRTPTFESLQKRFDKFQQNLELLTKALRAKSHEELAEKLDEVESTVRPTLAKLLEVDNAVPNEKPKDSGSQRARISMDVARQFIDQMAAVTEDVQKTIADANLGDPQSDDERGDTYDGFLAPEHQYDDTNDLTDLAERAHKVAQQIQNDFVSYAKKTERKLGIGKGGGRGKA